MLIEVMTETHGPCLHRPDHHESWKGHRVVTAIDVLRLSPESAPGTHSPPRRSRTRRIFPVPPQGDWSSPAACARCTEPRSSARSAPISSLPPATASAGSPPLPEPPAAPRGSPKPDKPARHQSAANPGNNRDLSSYTVVWQQSSVQRSLCGHEESTGWHRSLGGGGCSSGAVKGLSWGRRRRLTRSAGIGGLTWCA